MVTPITAPEVYLASTSPRRHELLCQIGVAHHCLSVSVDESRQVGESPECYVKRVAEAKAEAGLNKVSHGLMLAADTVIAMGDTVFGKPQHRDEARAMLAQLAGRTHEVLTGVAVIGGERRQSVLSRTRVVFRSLEKTEIDAYVATGEGDDKAGAYAIQGRAAVFVERIDGSYSGVVGLPLCETAILLRR